MDNEKHYCKNCWWAKIQINSVMVICRWFHAEVYGGSLGCEEWCDSCPVF